jgi:SAM-dependent methyltransferase
VSFYRERIVPLLLQLAMRNRQLVPYRRRVIAGAEGRVLEIGIGSGLNLPLYGDQATSVIGLDPSPKLLAMARALPHRAALPVDLREGTAEAIPLDSGSVDTVVTTWSLCTIPDAMRALDEVRRVLKPDGRLLFVEHGLAPEAGVRRWQNRLTPAWKAISGGCHLNRRIDSLITDAGFRIEALSTGYAKGPRPMTFMYEGSARRA